MHNYKEIAGVFKAFCDETRVKILVLLQDGEKCACELLEELHQSQSGLSYHMKILLEAGIVSSRVAGKWTHYRICEKGRKKAFDLLAEITSVSNSIE